ncbi:hypothetical protein J6590_026649 [Homalodisca vitripennis]|nr:hypothetical protein J6590_026649 [Homalodisca vitripennis]
MYGPRGHPRGPNLSLYSHTLWTVLIVGRLLEMGGDRQFPYDLPYLTKHVLARPDPYVSGITVRAQPAIRPRDIHSSTIIVDNVRPRRSGAPRWSNGRVSTKNK